MYYQGDYYITVADVSDPREDHVVVIALFADECRKPNILFMNYPLNLTRVNELSIRFGLQSSSITAGVLRGEKSRIALFADTINTLSRMERTCKSGKIQISEVTARYFLCMVGLRQLFSTKNGYRSCQRQRFRKNILVRNRNIGQIRIRE